MKLDVKHEFSVMDSTQQLAYIRELMAKSSPKNVDEAIALLREAGMSVKRRGPFRKQSFQIEEELYKKFKDAQARLGWDVQDCINDALEMWVKAHEAKKK